MLLSRLAPTPSGFLHEGNLFAFVTNQRIAKEHGALLGLRIDDIDTERFREAYLEDIFKCLESLSIIPAFGPKNSADFHANYRQTLRYDTYFTALNRLWDMGLLFACTCSRTKLSAQGKCVSSCRTQPVSRDNPDVAWRINLPEDLLIFWDDGLLGPTEIRLADHIGDVALRKRDGSPTYQIASVCDDALMGIGLIVRGLDLLPSTALQTWLGEHLFPKWNTPMYFHHQLIVDERGQKLSKSNSPRA